jgi:hypothetical protein
MTEQNGKSSAGLAFIGDLGASAEALAAIIGSVADLVPEDESKFTFIAPHEMHQAYGDANQREISRYLHVPGVKYRTIRNANCDVWI